MTATARGRGRGLRNLAAATVASVLYCGLALAPGQTAHAVPVTFATSGTSLATFFAGQSYESTGQFLGSSFPAPFPVTTTVELTPGVALLHTVNLFDVFTGPHPGGIGGPTQTIGFLTSFSAGGDIALVGQQVTYSVVANSQFQVDIGDSSTVTLNLGPLGLLDVTMEARSFQVPGGTNGVTASARATLLLHDAAAPAPEPGALALLGLGLAGLGVMRRQRH